MQECILYKLEAENLLHNTEPIRTCQIADLFLTDRPTKYYIK